MNAKKKVLKKKAVVGLSFEDAYRELEEVVRALESSQAGLTDSLRLYEKGVGCLKVCYQALESAERKIELLTGVGEEGEALTEPFDDSPSDSAPGTRRRASGKSAGGGEVDVEDEDSADAEDGGRLF